MIWIGVRLINHQVKMAGCVDLNDKRKNKSTLFGIDLFNKMTRVEKFINEWLQLIINIIV